MPTATLENYSDQTEINSPEFSKDGKPKEDIKAISNANQALQIAQKLEWNDRDRDIRRARVLSAFNGAAPYCAGDLVAKAQSYRYNVSFGFLEGTVGRAVVPYNDLSINIQDLTEIDANLTDEKKKIVQVEFGKIVQKWGRWAKFITRLNQDLVINGYNTAIFPSDYDPFPIFCAQKEGFVDEMSPNDVNDLQCYVWRKPYMLHELYARIRNTDTAKTAGWDVENVRAALTQAAPQSIYNQNASSSGQWTAVESAIRGGSLWASIVGAKMVNTYHVFATEIDGSVTHYIVLNNQQAVDKVNEDAAYTDFDLKGTELFKKENRFKSMRDFLVYFDLETGDGTWHGSKGIGQRAFNTHTANDKLLCAMLDQTFTSGLTILQPQDQLSQEEFTLTVVGPFAVIPPGIGIQNVPIPAVAATSFQAASLLTATSEQRIGDVVPQAAQMIQQAPETATAARLKAGRQQLITKGNLKRYVDPLSEVMSIMVRRFLKENSPNAYAKEFQKELKRQGITTDDIKEIRGARNTGRIEDILGNTAANTQIIFAEFRGDPEVDQTDLKRRRIASVLDADAAEELLISDTDQTKQIESQRMQELEITTILSGLKVPVSPRDNHEIHLKVGFEWLGGIIQQQAQNFNPQVIPSMKQIVEHLSGHMGYLEADKSKKAIYKEAKEKMDLTVDTIKDLESQAKQMASAAFDQAAKLATTPEELQQAQQAKQQLEQTQPQT